MLAFFSVAERSYNHISVNETTLTLALWALCAGMVLAAVSAFYQARVAGGLVRTLVAAEAFDETRAKTLAELGKDTATVRGALRRNRVLRRFVLAVEQTDGAVRYYIPEEERYRAAVRYEKKGIRGIDLVLTVLLIFATGILLVKLLPLLLSAFDAIFN